MATETSPPQSGAGGSGKYAVIGVLLIGAAIAVYYGMNCQTPPPPPPSSPDAGPPPRPTAMQAPDLIMQLEPDAGSEPDAGPPRERIVYRYVRSNWDCAGDIPAATASTIIRSNRRQLRNCYERALKRNHTLAGTLSLRLRVDHSGGVSGVQVGGSLRDPEVFSCVRNLANRWHFPSPTGGSCVVVGQTFNFTPQE